MPVLGFPSASAASVSLSFFQFMGQSSCNKAWGLWNELAAERWGRRPEQKVHAKVAEEVDCNNSYLKIFICFQVVNLERYSINWNYKCCIISVEKYPMPHV